MSPTVHPIPGCGVGFSGTPGTTGYLERRMGALRPGAYGVAVVAPQSDQERATHGRRYECGLQH